MGYSNLAAKSMEIVKRHTTNFTGMVQWPTYIKYLSKMFAAMKIVSFLYSFSRAK